MHEIRGKKLDDTCLQIRASHFVIPEAIASHKQGAMLPLRHTRRLVDINIDTSVDSEHPGENCA